MTQLLKNGAGIVEYKLGETVKGTVVDSNPSRILLDMPGGLTGIITKKEAVTFGDDENVIEPGAQIEAVVLDDENDQGLVVLSLRRASQDMIWAELNVAMEEGQLIKIKVSEANKGGLMATYKGLKAFLPVSQLTPVNYPRVDGADASVILQKLQKHIGTEFVVRVINVDRQRGKIIISEKAAQKEQAEDTLKNLKEGDRVKGHVSGVVKFGIFVTFGGVEGLVHLSELDWGHVSDPSKHYGVGDEVEILVIGVDGRKLSFSIKRLTEDPWKELVTEFAEGLDVEGSVTRWNTQGVFIDLKENVQGFFSLDQFPVEAHTELPSKASIREGVKLKGSVQSVNFDSHRIELRLDTDSLPKGKAEESAE